MHANQPRLRRSLATVLATLSLLPIAWAYPPAPHHLLYGLVRDETGNPIQADNAEVILISETGAKVSAPIVTGVEPGLNYKLAVPMDSGIASDLYQPSALRPTLPFRLQVRIGDSIYLPIEMKGDYAQMGAPGKRTRIDLTLGEDSDGDGLPDAWERALIAASGGGKTLKDINPNDDDDADGLRNLDEYAAGTYAFDNKDGFALKIIGAQAEVFLFEFVAIRGRTYGVQGSADLTTWTPVEFRLVPGDPEATSLFNSYATETSIQRISVASEGGQPPYRFFRLMTQ